MRHTLRIAPVIAVLVALLGGCASTPMASLESDADAKRFETAPNAAIVYLYRPPAPGGDAAATLYIDGRLIGETLPTTFFRVPLRGGTHRITVSGSDVGRLNFDTIAGNVYFVEMQVLGDEQSGTTTIFRPVAPEIGKATIASCCRLIEAWRPGQSRFNF